ncbi:MAG: hypothetical protein J0I12_21180 [Candidatus Eremiobacteraeota bacterium]|nr:hypothetical protein [Candidatus Eremiobacteraeota bacterium]
MIEPFAIGIPGLEPERRKINWELIFLHVLIALAGFAGFTIVYVNSLPCHCPGQLTACKSNCKNIATALEMYSSDNAGAYPDNLQQLIPGNYLRLVPTCPAAGAMTYTNYRVSHNPESFSFACVGNNHAKSYTGFSTSSTNFPQYDAESGLIDHP